MKLDDKQLEKLLASLPRFEISKQADKKFYAKLNALAEEKFEEQREALTRPSFFSFPRLAKGAALWRGVNSLASLRLGLAGAFAALLLVVGGTVWAYQPSTTRGKLMYPWKQTVEKVELAFAFSDMQKVDAHLKFSDRRLEEAQNIVGKSSSLAFLLKTAFADEGEVELTDEEQANLEATLEDMRSEVTKASEIVVAREIAPEKASQALERIEKTSNQHIETLNNLERRAAKEAKTIVRLVADNEDERLATVMQAREEVKQALEKRERKIKLIINVRRERLEDLKDQFNDELRRQRIETAKQQFAQTMEHFENLPQIIKTEFTAEIEKAKQSLETGRFGMAEGLSRVVEMREMRFKLQPPPQPDAVPDQPPLPLQPAALSLPLPALSQPAAPAIGSATTGDGSAAPAESAALSPDAPAKPFQPAMQPVDKPADKPENQPKDQDAKPPLNPNQPKPILINKPDQQKPEPEFPLKPDQQPEQKFGAHVPSPPPSPPMPKDNILNINKGMEKVDNLIRGLQEAGGNFAESK
ncbi:hypothetical protein HZC21_00455 [Candidatus Peregrinibacteria bacterium]|nr:hypothetical protein [Candidatus Peregrinibacteria bacterium]